jgi:hypothetical protein
VLVRLKLVRDRSGSSRSTSGVGRSARSRLLLRASRWLLLELTSRLDSLKQVQGQSCVHEPWPMQYEKALFRVFYQSDRYPYYRIHPPADPAPFAINMPIRPPCNRLPICRRVPRDSSFTSAVQQNFEDWFVGTS